MGGTATSVQEPIRVLHLRDSPWVDGPGRTILETASRIDRSRIDYSIAPLISDNSSLHPLVVAARDRGLPVQPIVDDGRSFAALVERTVDVIDRFRVQILHSSEFRTNLVALRCRSRRPALKIVSTAHGWIANDMRGKIKVNLDRILLRSFDTVVLVSHDMRRRLPRWWVPDERVHVIHNALMGTYGQGTTRARSRAPNEAVAILAVGRLSPEKGFDILLRAIAELRVDYPQLHLTIAGTGPEEPALRQLSADLGLQHRVNYAGYVANMPEFYFESDLVVQSSLTEGLPNVMLEAAYLGVPVIATDVGGTREVILHDASGLLVKAGSVSALASGIRRYLAQPEVFIAMAEKGRQHIEKHFSMEARTMKQMDLYERLAGRNA